MRRLSMRVGWVVLTLGALHCDGDVVEGDGVTRDGGVDAPVMGDTGISWEPPTSADADHVATPVVVEVTEVRPVMRDRVIEEVQLRVPLLKEMEEFRVVADGGTN